MTWSNCIIEGWIFIKPFGYTTYQTFIVYRSNIAEYRLKAVMRCKCDIPIRSLDMKPEPFLDSNLCVVKMIILGTPPKCSNARIRAS